MANDRLHFGWYIPTHGEETRLGDPTAYHEPNFDYFMQVADACEEAGLEYTLVPVNVTCYEAWVACSMVSARTSKLTQLIAARPGYIVPTLMAKMIATFDQMSQGRISINLISSTSPADGVYYEHDERYEVMDETCEIMKLVWTNDRPVDYDGKHFRLRGARVLPKPYQQPWPRFYIGGVSPAARDVGAKHADCYLFWGQRPEEIAEAVADIRRRAEAQGRDPAAMDFGMRLQIVMRATEEDAWDAAWELIGSAPETFRERVAAAARGDSHANRNQQLQVAASAADDYRIGPHLWTGISTVRSGAGTAIVGNPEQVAATLQEFVDAGCTEFCLSGYPHDEAARDFGRLIMPQFADQLAPGALALAD